MQVWIEPDIGYVSRRVVDGILCNFGLILLLFEPDLKISFIIEVLETVSSASFTLGECSTLSYFISKFYFETKSFQVAQAGFELQPS